MDEQNRRVHQFGKGDCTVLYVSALEARIRITIMDTYGSFCLSQFRPRDRMEVRIIESALLQRLDDPSAVREASFWETLRGHLQ